MAKIFKCYSDGDKPQDMLFIGINDIKKITSCTVPGGKSKLIIDYYDDEFCLNSTFFCDKIVTIDPDNNEDFKIWRYS